MRECNHGWDVLDSCVFLRILESYAEPRLRLGKVLYCLNILHTVGVQIYYRNGSNSAVPDLNKNIGRSPDLAKNGTDRRFHPLNELKALMIEKRRGFTETELTIALNPEQPNRYIATTYLCTYLN